MARLIKNRTVRFIVAAQSKQQQSIANIPSGRLTDLIGSDDSTDEDVSNQPGQLDLSKLDIYLRDFDLHLINFLIFKLDMNLSSKTIPDSAKRYQEISNDDTDSEIKIPPHLMWFVLSEMNQKVKFFQNLLILIHVQFKHRILTLNIDKFYKKQFRKHFIKKYFKKLLLKTISKNFFKVSFYQ